MNNYLLLTIFIIFGNALFAQNPQEVESEEVFMIVEQSPRFPGCEDILGSKVEKEACAQKEMLTYIYGNLKYPKEAREKGIKGQVIIQFVVNKRGKIVDISLLRGIGGGCDEASLAIVKGMNDLPVAWTPGHHRGKPVKVKYTLPIKFALEGESKKKKKDVKIKRS